MNFDFNRLREEFPVSPLTLLAMCVVFYFFGVFVAYTSYQRQDEIDVENDEDY